MRGSAIIGLVLALGSTVLAAGAILLARPDPGRASGHPDTAAALAEPATP